MYCYKYPRPAMTTDALIFGFDENKNELRILLIKRKNEPYKEHWAIPGGFVDMDETVEQCAKRELQEETNLICNNLSLLTVASKVDRDPRGRTISAVFWAIIPIDNSVVAGDDAAELNWFPVNNLPDLAFDHDEIISLALKELKFRLDLAGHFTSFFAEKNIYQNISKIKQLV